MLKTRKPEPDQEPSASGADSSSAISTAAVSSMQKRRVAFPDGVNPGDDVAPVEATEENGEARNRSKKVDKYDLVLVKDKTCDLAIP